MSHPDLIDALDQCIDRIEQGEPLQACLASYPQLATELAPALALSAELRGLPKLAPPPEKVASGREMMLSALGESAGRASPAGWWSLLQQRLRRRAVRPNRRWAPALKGIMAVAAMLLIAGSLVVTAAADTLPGDTLYPVKRGWEEARLAVTFQESARRQLTEQMERRRRQEVEAVLTLGRRTEVEFAGVIQTQAADVLSVDGLELRITAGSEGVGSVRPGQKVAVRAQVEEDGTLTALTVATAVEGEPAPAVPSFPASPTPSPTTAPSATLPPSRSTATRLPPTVAPPRADVVDASATPQPGTTRSDAVTRAPSSTPAPTLRPSPEATLTREPTRATLPSRTPEPTPVPDVDVAPSPTPEIRPTDRPVVEATATTTRPATDVRPSPTPAPLTTPAREPTPTAASDANSGADRPP